MPDPRTPALIRFDHIDSTSLHARRLVESSQTPALPTAFIARTQSAGRGQLGRAFASPPGGLWFTLLIPLPTPAHEAAIGPDSLGIRVAWASLAAVRAALLRAHADPERARFKWPNDIRVDHRKVLGSLTELAGSGPHRALLIGIGCNADCTLADLPEHLHTSAATLRDLTNQPIDPEPLLADLLANLADILDTDHLTPHQHALLAPRLALLGSPITARSATGQILTGTLAGLSPIGLPLIQTADGRTLPVHALTDNTP